MTYKQLLKKYGPEELAESFVFRVKLSKKEKKEADAELKKILDERRTNMPEKQKLLMQLMSLKFRMDDYYAGHSYQTESSFGNFLKEYLKLTNKKNKEFANDLGIEETELSQLINDHRRPSEKILVRLELHSEKPFQPLPGTDFWKKKMSMV